MISINAFAGIIGATTRTEPDDARCPTTSRTASSHAFGLDRSPRRAGKSYDRLRQPHGDALKTKLDHIAGVLKVAIVWRRSLSAAGKLEDAIDALKSAPAPDWDAIAAELLPCIGYTCRHLIVTGEGVHSEVCPAHYRPRLIAFLKGVLGE